MNNKKILILPIIGIIMILTIRWAWPVSFLSINIDNAKAGQTFSYTITNQANKKTTLPSKNSNSIKLRVPKGTYEVSAISSDGSAFSVTKTSGFFATTNLKLSTSPEKDRQFIGNNPKSCFNLFDSILVSYTCSGTFTTLQTHQPATKSLPSITKPTKSIDEFGYIEGIIQTAEGKLVIERFSAGSESDAAHYAVIVDKDLLVTKYVKLGGLDDNTSYSIAPYKSGFAAYSSSLNKVLYFSSINTNPEVINLDSAKEKKILPTYLDISGDTFVSTFSSTEVTAKNKSKSEIIVTKSGKAQHFVFNDQISKAISCGDNSICTLSEKGMTIYGINSGKAKQRSLISGVADIQESTSGVRIINSLGVMIFNPASQSGYYEYSFGSYHYSSIQSVSDGYLLALTNNKSNKITLKINATQDVQGKIDQQVSMLQSIDEVNLVNTYGSYIYVSANMGSLTYNSTIKGYDYDPAIKSQRATAIQDKIKELGIDTTKYTISSNTF